MRRLLYLHGFRSIGRCTKGEQLLSFAPDVLTPNLPYVPSLAIAYVESLIIQYGAQNLCLVGSSLGGYYATYLAEKYQMIAVLINPVVFAYETLLLAIGKVSVSHNGEAFFWDLPLVESLKQYKVKSLNPNLYCVLLQSGDTVLDYRIAKNYFRDCKCVIEDGGSHRFENFIKQKDVILEWANM